MILEKQQMLLIHFRWLIFFWICKFLIEKYSKQQQKKSQTLSLKDPNKLRNISIYLKWTDVDQSGDILLMQCSLSYQSILESNVRPSVGQLELGWNWVRHSKHNKYAAEWLQKKKESGSNPVKVRITSLRLK